MQSTPEDRLRQQTMKHEQEMIRVYGMLGLEIGGFITSDHIDQLKTKKQIEAVAWCKCNRQILKGSLADKHNLLKQLFQHTSMTMTI